MADLKKFFSYEFGFKIEMVKGKLYCGLHNNGERRDLARERERET